MLLPRGSAKTIKSDYVPALLTPVFTIKANFKVIFFREVVSHSGTTAFISISTFLLYNRRIRDTLKVRKCTKPHTK